MRMVATRAIVIAVTVLSATPALAQRMRGLSPQEAARHGWLGDYEQAKRQARTTGKPIMLVFRCVP